MIEVALASLVAIWYIEGIIHTGWCSSRHLEGWVHVTMPCDDWDRRPSFLPVVCPDEASVVPSTLDSVDAFKDVLNMGSYF